MRFSNHLSVAGLFFLACALCCVLYVISDFVFGGTITLVSTLGSVVLFSLLWFVLPLMRRARS